MTPAQLAAHAAKACVDETSLVLVIERGRYPRRFPRGEILNEHLEHGKPFRTYRFDAEAVLKWLLKNGAVTMKQVDGGIAFSDVEPPSQTTRENEG
jgi:hypothetical protein